MKKYGFGVDVGGTTCKIGLFEVSGNLVEKWEIPTRKEDNGEFILPDIAKSIKSKMATRKLYYDDIEGIGIGVPGPVKEDGTVLRAVNLGWSIFNVKETLENLISLSVKVGNDANVAALGEMWQGGAKGYKNIVFITLGTGVGGGIIVDGKILPGANGCGGEVGHITVNQKETISCGCGRRGCLEQYASATGLVRMANNALKSSNKASTLRNVSEVTAREVFDHAKAGDELAIELANDYARILGQTLSNIACVIDPEVIVLGGGVSKAGEYLTDLVQKYFSDSALIAFTNTKIVLAQLGNDAGMFGAVKQILI